MTRLRPWRQLLAPGLAALVALAILLGLGTWQLQRRAWKEGLIARLEAQAEAEPGPVLPESRWAEWGAADEFRRVRLSGTLLHEHETPVHGLYPGQKGAPLQGFYLFTPLLQADGSLVIVNRGFVPTELRDPARRPESRPAGETTVTGLLRAPEIRGAFVPENDPARDAWFTRDPAAIARAKGLARVAPFYVEAQPGAASWPRGVPSRVDLPNNHLQYALTWYGLALTLVGVFGAFAWRRLKGEGGPGAPIPDSAERA